MPFLSLFSTAALRHLSAALLFVLLLAGCQPVMSISSSSSPGSEPKWDNTVADWPFSFKWRRPPPSVAL